MRELNRPDCAAIGPWLEDHRQGRSGRMQEAVDRHLAGCASCRDRVAFLELAAKVTADTGTGARLGFERKLDRLAVQAEARVVPGRYQRRFVTGLLGFATAAIVLVGSAPVAATVPSTAIVAAVAVVVGAFVAASTASTIHGFAVAADG